MVTALGASAYAQAAPVGMDAGQKLGADLSAARAASPRPPACVADGSRATGRTHWERAQNPRVGAFCDALALGYAQLSRAPDKALAAAARARALAPDSAAPWVLEARALVGAGRPREAFALFSKARALDKQALAEPAALHDLALSAIAAGEHAEAVAAYRALVPRAGMLADARRRQRVYLEGAMAVMRHDAQALDEALGYLGEARRLRGLPGLSDVVLGATALTLDRQGRHDEARGVAAEVRGPLGVARLAESPNASALATLADGELAAIAAMLAERGHPDVAKRLWKAFSSSASPGSPWQAHAKKHQEAGGAPPRRAGKPR